VPTRLGLNLSSFSTRMPLSCWRRSGPRICLAVVTEVSTKRKDKAHEGMVYCH